MATLKKVEFKFDPKDAKPMPINKRLTSSVHHVALDAAIEVPEINLANYDHDEVCSLNEWALMASAELPFVANTLAVFS